MLRKRAVTKQRIPALKTVVDDGYSKLLYVRAVFGSHFKQTDKVMHKLERIVEDYASFQKDAEEELAERTQ
jgi:hypothetical protein